MQKNTKSTRFRAEGCDSKAAAEFIELVEKKGFVRTKFAPVSDNSHLERFHYNKNGAERLSIVFDTKARILTIDGKQDVVDGITGLYPGFSGMKTDLSVGSNAKKTKKEKAVPKEPLPALEKEPPKEQPKEKKKKIKPAKKTEQTKPLVLQGVDEEKVDWVIRWLKESGVKVRAGKVTAAGEKSFGIINAAKEKASITYAQNGTVSIQGKKSKLFEEIGSQFSERYDRKILKKYLPVSSKHLSESSKIDFSNALSDLDKVSGLSDYSILLVGPYRALEKFIFDLQHERGIQVKMIGQAYDKDSSGKYILKRAYQKRIGSVVYSEVMVSLYEEYFKTRNFYTHSDNAALSHSRGIQNKDDLKEILMRLVALVEYNCKKLEEIDFFKK